MFTNSKVAKSIRLAIAFGAASTMAFSNAALAQEENEEAAEPVEKIQVTGSRIKRADLEGALPVTVIDREAIDFSGQTSVADLLRNTSFNSTGSFRPQSGSSAQGVSQINLRGLGASRSLVLVDGRRLARSPSTGSSQDLNGIPAAAVERIEILTDGASAVYGSDAIGGVVNIITRKDFNGVELRLGAAEIEHEGGDREEGSLIFGASSDKGSMLGGISWNSRDIVFARDFPWYSPGGSFYSQNFRDYNRSDASWTSLGPNACDQGEFYTIPYGPAIPNSDGDSVRCGFNFASVSADEASTGNVGFFMNSRYEINDDWSVYANMNMTKSKSFGRYAPSLAMAYVGPTSPNNPTNPDSPYYDPAFNHSLYNPAADPTVGSDGVYVLHRFAGLGNRDNDVDNYLQDILFGFEGDIDGVLVDFGVRRNKSRTYDIGRNYVVIPIAEQYMDQGDYLMGDVDRNPADVLNSMKATISRIGDYNQDEVYGTVQFDLFDMDGGTAVAIVGGEWRDILFNDQYDSLSEGGVIGGSAGNSAGGARQASAVFVEAVFPVQDDLEVTAALRRDRYSDYGSDTSPKVSVRYNPTDELVLRASYGEGFRAPTLDILTQKESFSADSVRDEQHCLAVGLAADCSDQINAFVIANPFLESETSKQYAFGVAYEPAEWLDFSLDYFNIKIDNRIKSFSSGELINLQNAGRALPSGMSVERNQFGEIERVVRGFGNQGTLETSGLDLNLNTRFDLNEFGALRQNLTFSYTSKYDVDGVDQMQFDAFPEYRGVLANVYSIGDFDVAWNVNVIGDTTNPSGDPVPHWITNDVQVTYNANWNGKVTVGVRNLSGKEPILGTDPNGSRDYNFNLYDGYGRTVYARYTQSF
ncbi:TonB-dependent receptor [Alteromonas sp. LMIT006]|uniref:TonB-dependent receptor plug domain-containing protein n=1 Tax=Alteromonadaceae TaxID=72275 RepID=UPI0020CA3827|nr:TonB-dependent receptor [Alteromonas sp. LMIT006]UTP71726.1 TonB-dependent receptor [Alteromonas sp. LMIT006]